MNDKEILSLLKKKGHRMTMARQAIARMIVRAKKPLSAADIHSLLSKESSHPNLVTVYRELAFLEKEGVLRSMKLKDGVKRYCNAAKGHHHHLVCTNCDTVKDVDMSCYDLHAVERTLAKKNKFSIKSHSLEFYGLCSNCH